MDKASTLRAPAGPWTGPILLLLLPALAAVGCTGLGSGTKVETDGGSDDGGSIHVGDSGSEDDCGDTSPVIQYGPFCDYQGLDEPEPGDPEVPVMRIWSNVHDEDGDLHYRAVRMWFDGEPLGEIDTETANFKEKGLTQATDHPCETFDGTPSDKWYLTEAVVEWEAMYDWGMAVADAEGRWTDMEIVTCQAPTAKGTEP